MDWFNSLPEGLKVWLVAASANAAGGFVSELAIRLFDASSATVRRKLKGEPQQQALQRALAQALAASLHAFRLEPDLEAHYRSLFEDWLLRELVVEELAKLLDAGDEVLNRELLAAEFKAAGADAEWLVDVDFDAVLDLLVAGFVTAAAGETDLRDPLKVKLLEEMAQRMGSLERLSEYQVSLNRQAVGHLHRIDLLTKQITEGQDVTNDLLLEIVHLLSEARVQGPAAQQEAVQKAETTLNKVGAKAESGVAVGDQPSVQVTADLQRIERLLEEIHHSLSGGGVVQRGKYTVEIGHAQGLVIGDHAQVTQVFGSEPLDNMSQTAAATAQSSVDSATSRHLRQQLSELQRRYETLSNRIAAVEKDLGRTLDEEHNLTLRDRLKDLITEREVVAKDMAQIERQLGS